MSSTICPLYKEAVENEPWKQKQTAHSGLLFDKFPAFWENNSGEYQFEKADFLNGFVRGFEKVSFPDNLIEDACRRQREMVEKLGGKILILKNASRFVTGMGREHPLENGFTWHHTLGVPFLPGSSFKGILRAWYRESCGEIVQNKKGDEIWQENEQTERWFGSQEKGVGKFICLDMLPLEKPRLVVEIMTPHYGPYYQDESGKTAPGDWHNPVPIPFLAVEAGTSWQVAIIPGPSHRTIDQSELEKLEKRIPLALSCLGAGAKTAVGYGRFEHQPDLEKELQQEELRRKQEQLKAQQREAELSALSPSRRKLAELAEQHQWETNNSAFLENVEYLLQKDFEFDEDAILCLKDEYLEAKWKGIWDNPDAKKGKKKDKPKYNERAAAIVHKLKEILKTLSGNG